MIGRVGGTTLVESENAVTLRAPVVTIGSGDETAAADGPPAERNFDDAIAKLPPDARRIVESLRDGIRGGAPAIAAAAANVAADAVTARITAIETAAASVERRVSALEAAEAQRAAADRDRCARDVARAAKLKDENDRREFGCASGGDVPVPAEADRAACV